MSGVPVNQFLEWWRELNEELNKLHKGQQAGFKNARDKYHDGWSPRGAAERLMEEWSND